MDDKEIYYLFAETLALEHILSNVLYELKLLDPRYAEAISRGFDNAARHIEDLAVQAGKASPPEHLVKALEIIENLRTASLGRRRKPRGVV
jgi:hypothetical protein